MKQCKCRILQDFLVRNPGSNRKILDMNLLPPDIVGAMQVSIGKITFAFVEAVKNAEDPTLVGDATHGKRVDEALQNLTRELENLDHFLSLGSLIGLDRSEGEQNLELQSLEEARCTAQARLDAAKAKADTLINNCRSNIDEVFSAVVEREEG